MLVLQYVHGPGIHSIPFAMFLLGNSPILISLLQYTCAEDSSAMPQKSRLSGQAKVALTMYDNLHQLMPNTICGRQVQCS